MKFRIFIEFLFGRFMRFVFLAGSALLLSNSALSVVCTPPALFNIPATSFDALFGRVNCLAINAPVCEMRTAFKDLRVHAGAAGGVLFEGIRVCSRRGGVCQNRDIAEITRDMQATLRRACLADSAVGCANRGASWDLRGGAIDISNHIGCQ